MVDGATGYRGAGEEDPARDSRRAHRDERAHRGTPRHRARIPGFAREGAEMGLGDALTRVTTTVGIRPCGGCARRAAALNRWMAFGGRPDR
ncbi:hypothetical protein LHJ74_12645 [Streptomyces sp. N2-109]|uniref:Uncharacterized protein n=1 Tax=Streptomyces gossypii TaxID=2883101 RepID=A0ABT2JSQ6_9ACTN|nr:hypothetical protein [Streptomyces gossypii]MCT2590748.1 hypothetical protein [Streptomyces gossypii]